MTWVDMLGYAASAAVLATFCMSTMIPLRILAVATQNSETCRNPRDLCVPAIPLSA